MELSKAYADRLNQLLNEKDWSSYKFSGKCAVPPSTLSNILLGKCKSCTLLTALNICRGFGITFQTFFASDIFNLENLDDN